MSLRNQPYFPLYVQDYLTDEKLNMCSWKTQGIYIKVLCILHKQTDYGSIVLFKQTSKQILDFALILIKQIPCSIEDMQEALEELIFYNVLTITDNKLLQKRMVKDGEVSLKRSKAGKTGGGNPNLFKQTPKQKVKQKVKQNTEDENANEDVNIIVNKDVIKKELNILTYAEFEKVWKDYPTSRREDKASCLKYWKQIPEDKKESFYLATKKYISENLRENYKFIKKSHRWFKDWETQIETIATISKTKAMHEMSNAELNDYMCRKALEKTEKAERYGLE